MIGSSGLRRLFVFYLILLIGKTGLAASLDAKASDEEPAKESKVAQGKKEEIEDSEAKDKKEDRGRPSPPVVTEHTINLPDGRTLGYKAITGYLLLRDTKEEQHPAEENENEKEEEDNIGTKVTKSYESTISTWSGLVLVCCDEDEDVFLFAQ